MITLTRITDADNPILAELLPIYIEAFPPRERRNEEQLKRLINESSNMHFNVVLLEGKTAGLFVYWDMSDFFFLEHLAISANMRNHKTGQHVLNWIAENLNELRLMEVEPITSDEFAPRRIAYYKRNSYKILDKSYQQPSYSDRNMHYPMWIMGNHETAELTKYLEEIITEVYTNHYEK